MLLVCMTNGYILLTCRFSRTELRYFGSSILLIDTELEHVLRSLLCVAELQKKFSEICNQDQKLGSRHLISYDFLCEKGSVSNRSASDNIHTLGRKYRYSNMRHKAVLPFTGEMCCVVSCDMTPS
jgi:hypothetical protein